MSIYSFKVQKLTKSSPSIWHYVLKIFVVFLENTSFTCVGSMGLVITVQPSIQMYLLNLRNISVHFNWKKRKKDLFYTKSYAGKYIWMVQNVMIA